MELEKAIKDRRSIRKFKDTPVPHELINEVVEIARFAPSWKNTQIARYIVVEDQKIKEEIANSCVYGFSYNIGTIAACPTLVVLTYIKNRSGYEKDGSATTSKGPEWQMFDCGVAAQTFALAAHSKGLGTCMMGIFEQEKVKSLLNIPEDQEIGVLLAMGYPDEAPIAPPRKEVEKLLTFYEG